MKKSEMGKAKIKFEISKRAKCGPKYHMANIV
jgi:hypothetical protein